MGRRNTTFTGADIIRMLASNISRSEQDDVILFLYLVIPEIAVDRIERRIFGEGMTARGVSSGRSIISWILLARRLVNLLTSLVRQRIITQFMSNEARKELPKAILLLKASTLTIRRR